MFRPLARVVTRTVVAGSSRSYPDLIVFAKNSKDSTGEVSQKELIRLSKGAIDKLGIGKENGIYALISDTQVVLAVVPTEFSAVYKDNSELATDKAKYEKAREATYPEVVDALESIGLLPLERTAKSHLYFDLVALPAEDVAQLKSEGIEADEDSQEFFNGLTSSLIGLYEVKAAANFNLTPSEKEEVEETEEVAPAETEA